MSTKERTERPTFAFVQGGPGVGKGTNCSKLAAEFGLVHLSAGDLLRTEKNKEGSAEGELIKKCLEAGTLVPAEVTIKLLMKAMEEKVGSSFLLDGFPSRSLGDCKMFIESAGLPQFALCLDVSEADMSARIGATGKSADAKAMLVKRYATYLEQAAPVKEYLDSLGLVRSVDASASVDDVYESVKALFDAMSVFA